MWLRHLNLFGEYLDNDERKARKLLKLLAKRDATIIAFDAITDADTDLFKNDLDKFEKLAERQEWQLFVAAVCILATEYNEIDLKCLLKIIVLNHPERCKLYGVTFLKYMKEYDNAELEAIQDDSALYVDGQLLL